MQNRLEEYDIRLKIFIIFTIPKLFAKEFVLIVDHKLVSIRYFYTDILFMLKDLTINKKDIAIFIAILFHLCGAIGILFSSQKDWFISNTNFNLLLMAALLIWVQPNKNLHFYLFFAISFLIGMGTEMIGVNTGKLFGDYQYGNVLGKKLNGVPFLIGINWFVVVYCSGVIITKFSEWIEEKYETQGIRIKPWITTVSFVIDGAMIATMFDYNLESVAGKLNYWHWKNDSVPMYNFVCWFVISGILLYIFKKLNFYKGNLFAVHLLIIQYLFFISLQIYLP